MSSLTSKIRPVLLDQYAVVGNPITHSKSPQIHHAFAKQTNQLLEYTAVELPINNFEETLHALQQQGYKGVNVTVPFKQQAWKVCDKRSPRAEYAGAVNTLVFGNDGQILGDNTDGVGIVRDLVENHSVVIKRQKILILGAGGAVRGVLAPLLALNPVNITISNRTVSKAQALADAFRALGNINACGYDELINESFDLIINATSTGLNDEIPPVTHSILGSNSVCYDMIYNTTAATPFVAWAREQNPSRAIDGLGMLVEQAAESFYVWRGVHPETTHVIQSLRQL